jgi:hypothetical protein
MWLLGTQPLSIQWRRACLFWGCGVHRAEQLEEMGVTALFEALGSCEDTVFVLGCKETGTAPIYMPTYKGHHTTKLLLKRRELIALDEALMFEYGACV